MKIAIVTGASSGMGREFVRQISTLGLKLDEIWMIARRKNRLLELQEEVHTPVRIIEGDLLEQAFFSEFQNLLEETKPDIRMLVNAAGFGKTGLAETISCKDQLDMITLNCSALTQMTLICLPYCKKGSRVIQLASAAAFCPQPSFSVYAATKSYVLSFTRSLKSELKKQGIVLTAVCPGPVQTEFFRIAGEMKNPMKKLVLAKPELVVRQALKDAKKKKAISVYGISMKAARIGSKLVPHGLILKGMEWFW